MPYFLSIWKCTIFLSKIALKDVRLGSYQNKYFRLKEFRICREKVVRENYQ